MEHTLYMIFETETGDKITVSLAGVKPTVTKEQVTALMDALINNDFMMTSKGALSRKVGMKVTTKAVTKFQV